MPAQIVKALLDNQVGQFMSTFKQQGMRAVEWKHTGPASMKYEGVEYPGDSWRLQIDSADHKAYAIFSLSVFYGWLGREDAEHYDSAKAAGMDSHGEVNMTVFYGDLAEREKRNAENERIRAAHAAAEAGGQFFNLSFPPYHYRDIGSLTWMFTLKKKDIKGYQRWFVKMARAVILPIINRRSAEGEPILDRDEFQSAIQAWASEKH